MAIAGPCIDVHQLAAILTNEIGKVLVIDSRCFIEYNICHVASAINVCCSKIIKRRLQQDKLSIKELLTHTCHCKVDDSYDVVVYDQCSKDYSGLPSESFTLILLKKLQQAFHAVHLLSGGFAEFQHFYPHLCGDKARKLPPLSSLSQPCLPVADQGPTRILPFLYLGSQFDALNKELLQNHNITYELNVSTNCPKPDFLPDAHFMRIPVNDSYTEKLLPHFHNAFHFLDKVRESSGCVLVHCLAGISRSPTIAIAYVMKYLRLTSDDGYRYVKAKRPTISPNFNFLGQLLEFEMQLKREKVLDGPVEECSQSAVASKKRLCKTDMRKTSRLSLSIDTDFCYTSKPGDQSPTTALAKLSFSGPPTPEVIQQPDLPHSRSFESMVDQLTEANGAFSSKVLSPVKEIKCESLISEISFGNGGAVNTRNTSRWKHNSNQSSASHTFHKERLVESVTSEKTKGHKSFSQLKLIKRQLKFHTGFDSAWTQKETVKSEKSQASKYSDSAATFSHLDSLPLPGRTVGVVYPCSRSDSATTSGFGSESSEMGRCSNSEFDLDELEDEVMLKSAETHPKHEKNFSFNLPEVFVNQELHSPLSPSESHLLEDFISNTSSSLDKSKTTSISSPRCRSSESDSHQDCGTSSSSAWSRKRPVSEDEPSLASSKHCDSSKKSLCSSNERTISCADVELSINVGLYRVQSCPGISFPEKTSDLRYTKQKITSKDFEKHRHSIGDIDQHLVRDILSSGSCPDVLNIIGQSAPSSPHFRDFRRSIRLIRVS